VKQDVVPGMTIPLTIQADRAGSYEIACSELCGLGHHQMRSVLRVLSVDAFEDWLAEPQQ
jgi:cytochrome c oxidase subunit 2